MKNENFDSILEKKLTSKEPQIPYYRSVFFKPGSEVLWHEKGLKTVIEKEIAYSLNNNWTSYKPTCKCKLFYMP